VGKRIEALLTLLEIAGPPIIDVHLRCSNPACGEAMEVELAVGELKELQQKAEDAGRPQALIYGNGYCFGGRPSRPGGRGGEANSRIRNPRPAPWPNRWLWTSTGWSFDDSQQRTIAG